MPQPPTIIDAPGGEIVKHGSQIVNFSLSGALIAEEIEWTKGFKSVEFGDYSNDSASGQPGVIKLAAYSQTKGIGSMVIQVKDANTVITAGEFVTFVLTGYPALKCLVTEVGRRHSQNGISKIPIQMAEWMSESPLPSLIALDGDFSTPRVCGPILFSRPFLNAGNSVLQYSQKFCIFRPFWTALAPNSVGLSNFYLIDETKLEDTGVADIVTWDRVYSTKPPDFVERGSAIKTIKYLQTSYTPGPPPVLQAVSVRTQTKTVACDIYWSFFLGSPNYNFPDLSDASVETIPWPTAPNGSGLYTFVLTTGGFTWSVTAGGNNAGYRFLSGEIGRWSGNIYFVKVIYG